MSLPAQSCLNRGCIPAAVVIAMAGAGAAHAAEGESFLWPAPRLSLEQVPAPATPEMESLPRPATWPILRHRRRLRILVIMQFDGPGAIYQRIARRCNADVDFRFYPRGGMTPKMVDGLGDLHLMAHISDHTPNPKNQKNPSAEEVSKRLHEHILETLEAAPGRYDAVFVEKPGKIVDTALLKYMQKGGLLVVCNNKSNDGYPPGDSRLASLWPATRHPKKRSWHGGGSARTGAAALMGLPLARLHGHRYMHVAQLPETRPGALAEARALATGGSGAAFVRRVGDGAVLFVPTGPISRKSDAVARYLRSYDHDEIWLRYWDQLLHGLVGGASALPVMADLAKGPDHAPPGRDYPLKGGLKNRAGRAQTVVVSAHVVSPFGGVVYKTAPEEMELAAGENRSWEGEVPVDPSWGGGLYAAYLTVGDPAAKKQLHQALQYIPVGGSVQLKLTADKGGYRIGEQATFAVEASSATAWKGEIRFGVYDFRGRLLTAETRPATLGAEPTTLTFTWPFADHGVRVDTVWAVAAAVKDNAGWARTTCKVYKHERWDMRNEYQWSVWSNMAGRSPCLVPRNMRLLAHAGYNALGFPAGGKELYHPAERWSRRMYDEGVGAKTWNPEIEAVTDEEIEAYLRNGKRRIDATLKSGALCLASVGEEAGFGRGWGRKYYWKTPIAPEKACQAFQRYLKEKYPDLETLNGAWHTNYKAWEEVKLTREFSGKNTHIGADGWGHPRKSPLGEGVDRVSMAPYSDTGAFYGWYYHKLIEAAQRLLREVNPVPLTFASAPSSGTFNPSCLDVRKVGTSGWRDVQYWTLDANAKEPGFGMTWGHFDWPVATENSLWGFVITRSGHNDYWVDVPLMFNADMTHTRATLAIRRWRLRTAHAERLLLDARPTGSDAVVLGPTGTHMPWVRRLGGDMRNSIKVALNQAGFGFTHPDWDDLAKHKIVFAVFGSALSNEKAQALNRYVEGGGTLVFGPRFAAQNEHRIPLETAPGFGLAAAWDLTVTEKNDRVPRKGRAWRKTTTAALDGLGAAFAGLKLESRTVLNEKVAAEGWTRLAQYSEDSPALLTRRLGKGRLVYLNAAYRSHKYIQFITPTGPARQGFYRLIETLCAKAVARRTYRIDGHLPEVLHMAALDWTDPTGRIAYALVRTQGQGVWTRGTLHWLGPQTTGYAVYDGDPQLPAPVYGKEAAVHLRPGQGRLFAFTSAAVDTIQVRAAPARLTPGEPLRVTVDILDAEGRPVPGAFPLDVRVRTADGEIPALRRDLSLESGQSLTLATALDDPDGRWTVAVRDGISRRVGTTSVDAVGPAEPPASPGFAAWGRPSELWEPERTPAREFVDKLEQLAEVYRRDPGDETWMVKQRVGAHYCYFGRNRHAELRDLLQVDWRRHVKALREAVQGGAQLILVGEDLGVDPAAGFSISPYRDATQIPAVIKAIAGATWSGLSADGEIVRAKLGRGSLVLSRLTPDGAGSSVGHAKFWLERFQQTLAADPAHPEIPAPDARALQRWLSGKAALVKGTRTVEWTGGWEQDTDHKPIWRNAWKESFDPRKNTTGPVFVLRMPPTGEVRSATFDLDVEGAGTVKVDIGADGTVDGDAGAAGAVPWAQAIRNHLAWRERACGGAVRDLNAWRLVPIRFRADVPFNIQVEAVKLTLE